MNTGLGAEPEGQSVPVQLRFLSELASKLSPPHPLPAHFLPETKISPGSPFSIQRVAITSAWNSHLSTSFGVVPGSYFSVDEQVSNM